MKRQHLTFALLALGSVFLAARSQGATIPTGELKSQYYIKNQVLMRGKTPVDLWAIETPDLLDKASNLGELVTTLNHVAEVGATAVCYNLTGLSADGTSIATESVDAFRATVDQVTWRRLGSIMRIFGPNAPEDLAFRQAVVEAVAKTFVGPRDRECLYLIDGPGAADLAKRLLEAAPELAVAAPANGDVAVVTDLRNPPADKPVLLMGLMPAPGEPSVHYVLPATEESYKRFDMAMQADVELKPWIPDNSVLSDEERAEGFIALFDGKTLDGWTITGKNKEGFVVRDGAIVWNSSGAGSLRTRDRYDNFVIRMDWRIGEGKNSGLHMRLPRTGRGSKIGVEFQMLGYDIQPFGDQTTGAIYDVVPPLKDASKPAGEWNTLEITFDGPHYKAILNGEVVQDVNFDENEELRYRLRRGFIALTDHGGEVAFRNIRLKPLPSDSAQDGAVKQEAL